MLDLNELFTHLDGQLFTTDSAPDAAGRLALFRSLADDNARLRCLARMESLIRWQRFERFRRAPILSHCA